MTRRSRGGDPGSPNTPKTAGRAIRPEGTARLDADADLLLEEARRFLEAGEQELAHALLEDSHEALAHAAAHALVCSGRARAFLSTALHVDLERTAA